MADPVVGITNGVPTSGTGTITTLGAVVTALGTPMQATGGSVTANAGTNLNTSALALETGGNLASIVTKLTSLVTGTVIAAGSALMGIVKIGDGTNTATVKAASTAALATDTALVVAISPNSAGSVAQGSTTSGQTGALIQGAVTTAAPTYTTASTSPLSLDGAGNLRVGVVPGNTETAASGVTIGTSGVGYLGWLSSIAKLLSNALTVTLNAATTGGLTETGILTTAIAVVGNVKASAGQLYKVEVSNNSASWVYLKLYNTAGTPTAGVNTPQRRIGIPPSSTLLTTTDLGGVYSTGIGYAIVGGAPDTDSSAVAANILVNFHWK